MYVVKKKFSFTSKVAGPCIRGKNKNEKKISASRTHPTEPVL
jgi:hypothetical protein